MNEKTKSLLTKLASEIEFDAYHPEVRLSVLRSILAEEKARESKRVERIALTVIFFILVVVLPLIREYNPFF